MSSSFYSKPLWLELAEKYDQAEQDYFDCDPENVLELERLDKVIESIVGTARYMLSSGDYELFCQGLDNPTGRCYTNVKQLRQEDAVAHENKEVALWAIADVIAEYESKTTGMSASRMLDEIKIILRSQGADPSDFADQYEGQKDE